MSLIEEINHLTHIQDNLSIGNLKYINELVDNIIVEISVLYTTLSNSKELEEDEILEIIKNKINLIKELKDEITKDILKLDNLSDELILSPLENNETNMKKHLAKFNSFKSKYLLAINDKIDMICSKVKECDTLIIDLNLKLTDSKEYQNKDYIEITKDVDKLLTNARHKLEVEWVEDYSYDLELLKNILIKGNDFYNETLKFTYGKIVELTDVIDYVTRRNKEINKSQHMTENLIKLYIELEAEYELFKMIPIQESNNLTLEI